MLVEEIKKEGNRLFQAKDFEAAFERYSECIDELERGDQQLENSHTVYSNAALAAFSMNNFSLARDYARRCANMCEEQNIAFYKGHFTLIRSLAEDGMMEEAQELLSRHNSNPVFDCLRISKTKSDFSLDFQMARGGYATTYLAQENTTKRDFRVKITNEPDNSGAIEMEAHILKTYAGSEYLPRIYWLLQTDKDSWLICQNYGERELWVFCQVLGISNDQISENIMYQIASGVEFLHSKKIIHRDLRCETISLLPDLTVKFSSLGYARCLDSNQKTYIPHEERHLKRRQMEMMLKNVDPGQQPHEHCIGTPQFLPPEVLANEENNFHSDLWGLGCVFFQLLCGCPPFHASTEESIKKRVCSRDLVFSHGISQKFQNLINDLIQYENRLPLENVLERLKNEKTVPKFSLVHLCLRKMSSVYMPLESDPQHGGWIGDYTLDLGKVETMKLSLETKSALQRLIENGYFFSITKNGEIE